MNREESLQTVAAKFRGANTILSPLNQKGVKSEAHGYLQAMLFLAPHQLAGGKSVCPFSTPACREGCLYSAGRGKTPRVENARLRRTRMYLHERDRFFDELIGELVEMQRVADLHGLRLAIRLNGTSDIAFERETVDGKTVFDLFPRARFFDYTRFPPHHRRVPENWHLTFSLADDGPAAAVAHLLAGRNVAAIMPAPDREHAPAWFMVGETLVKTVDGEESDLRFLDPSPALVMLRPKGRLERPGSPMVHTGLIGDLIGPGGMA